MDKNYDFRNLINFDGVDFQYGEQLLEEFEGLSNKSKAIIFSAIFNPDIDRESILLHFGSMGFEYQDCQSPIEEILKVAYDIKLAILGMAYEEVIGLMPQQKIVANGNTYYADFLIDARSSEYFECGRDYKLVIECDGHEFHEKTKAQVERRNQRDMDLKMEGYDILHFSGSQIYYSPNDCANRLLDYVMKNVEYVKWVEE